MSLLDQYRVARSLSSNDSIFELIDRNTGLPKTVPYPDVFDNIGGSGATGPTGYTGPAGVAGTQGATGYTGPAGANLSEEIAWFLA